jgi:hypothetical protein
MIGMELLGAEKGDKHVSLHYRREEEREERYGKRGGMTENNTNSRREEGRGVE